MYIRLGIFKGVRIGPKTVPGRIGDKLRGATLPEKVQAPQVALDPGEPIVDKILRLLYTSPSASYLWQSADTFDLRCKHKFIDTGSLWDDRRPY